MYNIAFFLQKAPANWLGYANHIAIFMPAWYHKKNSYTIKCYAEEIIRHEKSN